MKKISKDEYLMMSNPGLAMAQVAKRIMKDCQEEIDEMKTKHSEEMQAMGRKIDEMVASVKKSALDNFSDLTIKTTFDILKGNLDTITSEVAKKITIPKPEDGKPGGDGKTPVCGVDYPSNTQVKQMVKECIAADIPISLSQLEREFKNKETQFSLNINKIAEKLKTDFPKVEMTGEDIVTKINSLATTPDKQIDASHIKNLKKYTEKSDGKKRLGRGTSNPVNYYDLTPQCDGSNKTFTIPFNSKVLAVYSTQFPVVYRPLIDWTSTSLSLILTSEVNAPESQQTLFILYVE